MAIKKTTTAWSRFRFEVHCLGVVLVFLVEFDNQSSVSECRWSVQFGLPDGCHRLLHHRLLARSGAAGIAQLEPCLFVKAETDLDHDIMIMDFEHKKLDFEHRLPNTLHPSNRVTCHGASLISASSDEKPEH